MKNVPDTEIYLIAAIVKKEPGSDIEIPEETWRGKLADRMFIAAGIIGLAGLGPAISGYGWGLLALSVLCFCGWAWASILEDAAVDRWFAQLDADREGSRPSQR